MKTSEIKASIDKALKHVDGYAINDKYQVAVYSDGTRSGLLSPNTWEPVPDGVYELCRVRAWFDPSASESRNTRNRREEKKSALEKAMYRLSEIATL